MDKKYNVALEYPSFMGGISRTIAFESDELEEVLHFWDDLDVKDGPYKINITQEGYVEKEYSYGSYWSVYTLIVPFDEIKGCCMYEKRYTKEELEEQERIAEAQAKDEQDLLLDLMGGAENSNENSNSKKTPSEPVVCDDGTILPF